MLAREVETQEMINDLVLRGAEMLMLNVVEMCLCW